MSLSSTSAACAGGTSGGEFATSLQQLQAQQHQQLMMQAAAAQRAAAAAAAEALPPPHPQHPSLPPPSHPPLHPSLAASAVSVTTHLFPSSRYPSLSPFAREADIGVVPLSANMNISSLYAEPVSGLSSASFPSTTTAACLTLSSGAVSSSSSASSLSTAVSAPSSSTSLPAAPAAPVPSPSFSMSTFTLNPTLTVTCFRRGGADGAKLGPLFVVREFDAKVIRSSPKLARNRDHHAAAHAAAVQAAAAAAAHNAAAAAAAVAAAASLATTATVSSASSPSAAASSSPSVSSSSSASLTSSSASSLSASVVPTTASVSAAPSFPLPPPPPPEPSPTSEQAFRASIRQAMLNMNLRPEGASKSEIRVLKAQGILGKRAPSCSLLSAADMCRLLIAFGKEQCAEELREATAGWSNKETIVIAMGQGMQLPLPRATAAAAAAAGGAEALGPLPGLTAGLYGGLIAVPAKVASVLGKYGYGVEQGRDDSSWDGDAVMQDASGELRAMKKEKKVKKEKGERRDKDRDREKEKDRDRHDKQQKERKKRKRKAEASPLLTSAPSGLDALLFAVHGATPMPTASIRSAVWLRFRLPTHPARAVHAAVGFLRAAAAAAVRHGDDLRAPRCLLCRHCLRPAAHFIQHLLPSRCRLPSLRTGARAQPHALPVLRHI